MLRIDPKSPMPLGEQVRRGIRRAIAEGEIDPGDPLPPVRQLAGDLQINLNTVARAYRELEREGLVMTARGRGTLVRARRSNLRTAKEELRSRVRDLIADATLSGYDRREVQQLIAGEIKRMVK